MVLEGRAFGTKCKKAISLYLEEKLKGKVTDFKFRDKSKKAGMGPIGKITFQKGEKMHDNMLPKKQRRRR